MVLNFSKKMVVGVSVSPEIGLEAAVVDYENKTVLRYASKPLEYDFNNLTIADIDIFKEVFVDLLSELEIPKKSDVVLSIPTIAFDIKEYPAILNRQEIHLAIEDDLVEHPIFGETEAAIGFDILPNSTMQFNRVAWTVAQRTTLIEIAMQIKELGYNLVGINTSLMSTLNALIYNSRVQTDSSIPWVMAYVDNCYCRVISFQGSVFDSSFEERIAIGEVLGDTENYNTVVNFISPILKNLPSKYLCVISKTNIISAKVLASKLQYSSPIIYQEDNCFSEEPFIEVSENIDVDPKAISMSVIGAAIYREFTNESTIRVDLYNEDLGDIYLNEQPLAINLFGKKIVFTVEYGLKTGISFAIVLLLLAAAGYMWLQNQVTIKNETLTKVESEINIAKTYLDAHKEISAETFDEGDEIRIGLLQNKNVYSYLTMIGTEIPKKLWLTRVKFGKNTTLEGQADNLISIYSFYRNLKDYDPTSKLKIQKLSMATKGFVKVPKEGETPEAEPIISSLNADFYQFKISDTAEVEEEKDDADKDSKVDSKNDGKNESKVKDKKKKNKVPDLEPIEE